MEMQIKERESKLIVSKLHYSWNVATKWN